MGNRLSSLLLLSFSMRNKRIAHYFAYFLRQRNKFEQKDRGAFKITFSKISKNSVSLSSLAYSIFERKLK